MTIRGPPSGPRARTVGDLPPYRRGRPRGDAAVHRQSGRRTPTSPRCRSSRDGGAPSARGAALRGDGWGGLFDGIGDAGARSRLSADLGRQQDHLGLLADTSKAVWATTSPGLLQAAGRWRSPGCRAARSCATSLLRLAFRPRRTGVAASGRPGRPKDKAGNPPK